MPENIATYMMLALWFAVMLLIAIRFIRNKCAPIRQVKAKVIDKSKMEVFSRTGPKFRYAVVFQTAEGQNSPSMYPNFPTAATIFGKAVP